MICSSKEEQETLSTAHVSDEKKPPIEMVKAMGPWEALPHWASSSPPGGYEPMNNLKRS